MPSSVHVLQLQLCRLLDPPPTCDRLLSGGQQLRCLERAADAAAHDAERNARTMAAAAQHLNLCRPELALVVVYEDDHLAAVVKPQGVPCDTPPGRGQQPAAGTSGAAEEGGTSGGQQGPRPALPSVYTLLAHTLAPSRAPGALRRPRHVHRLDEPTGGLLLAAKSHRAQQELGAAFEERRVRCTGGQLTSGAAATARLCLPSPPTHPTSPLPARPIVRSPSATARWPGAAWRAVASSPIPWMADTARQSMQRWPTPAWTQQPWAWQPAAAAAAALAAAAPASSPRRCG